MILVEKKQTKQHNMLVNTCAVVPLLAVQEDSTAILLGRGKPSTVGASAMSRCCAPFSWLPRMSLEDKLHRNSSAAGDT